MSIQFKYGAIALFAFLIAIGLYFLTHSKSTAVSILDYIPEEAENIVVLNGKELTALLEKEVLFHPSKLIALKNAFFDGKEGNSKWSWLIESGVKYDDTLIGLNFQKLQQTYFIIASIADQNEFASRISDTTNLFHFEKVNDPRSEKYYNDSLQIILGIDGDKVIISHYQISANKKACSEFISTIFNQPLINPSNNISNQNQLPDNFHIFSWTRNKTNPDTSKYSYIISSAQHNLQFESNVIIIKTEMKLKNKVRFSGQYQSPKNKAQEVQINFPFELAKDLAYQKSIDTTFIDSVLSLNGMRLYEIIDAIEGNVRYTSNGTYKLKKEFITYEFDDDFNKIEKKSFSIHEIPSISLSINLNNAVKELIDKLEKKQIITNKGSFYTINLPSQYQWYLTVQNNQMTIGTEKLSSINDTNLVQQSPGLYAHISNTTSVNEQFQMYFKTKIPNAIDLFILTTEHVDESSIRFKTQIQFKDHDSHSIIESLLSYKGFQESLNRNQ